MTEQIQAQALEARSRGVRPDFSHRDLRGLCLKDFNLSLADFSGSDLSGADLEGCDLSHVNLDGCNLSRANLCWTNLSSSHMAKTTLDEAKLEHADLSGAWRHAGEVSGQRSARCAGHDFMLTSYPSHHAPNPDCP